MYRLPKKSQTSRDDGVIRLLFAISFGSLNAGDVTGDDAWRMLNRWTTMIEKELGTDEFRVVAGMEDPPLFRTVVFIGGVNPSQGFEGEWLQKWSDNGGSGGGLTEFALRS
jgi:hypothetical protein